jgi:hypothetical protein
MGEWTGNRIGILDVDMLYRNQGKLEHVRELGLGLQC